MPDSGPTASASSPITTQDLGLVLLGFVLYWMAYQCHELLQPYVRYRQGVDLLFLPAGIKLVMVIVTGWRGALGCGLALFSLATRFWPELDPVSLAAYAALSCGMTWAVVSLLLRYKALGHSLEGLSFRDIVQIDALNSLLHGIAVNSLFWSLGLRSGDAVAPTALAMALGDFLGSGAILLLVLLVGRVLVPQGRY